MNNATGTIRYRPKSIHVNPNSSVSTSVNFGKSTNSRSGRSRLDSDLTRDAQSPTTGLFGTESDDFNAIDIKQKRKKSTEKSVYTLESLGIEVELVQADLQMFAAQKASIEAEHAVIEEIAQAELEAAKSRRKTDEVSRGQLKTESKLLEESKHQLDTQRSRVEKANRLVAAELERKAIEKQEWLNDIETAKSKVLDLDKSIEYSTQMGQIEISSAHNELEHLQSSTTELEEVIKGLAVSMKRSSALKAATLEALMQAKSSTDEVTGIIIDSFFSNILDNPVIHSKLADVLKTESDSEKKLEEDWLKTQKDLETRYVKVRVMYNEAKETYAKTVESFLPNGMRDGFDEGEKLAPTSSNHSTGKKRRNRSRRNTRSQVNHPLYPVVSPNVPVTGGAFYDPTSISPRHSNSTGQSPEVPFPSLATSRSSVSPALNLPALSLDTEQSALSQSTELQSPSSLIPSYLFKDDITESLSNLLEERTFDSSIGQDNRFLDNFLASIRPAKGGPDTLPSAIGTVPHTGDTVPYIEQTLPHRQVSAQSSFSQLFQQQYHQQQKPSPNFSTLKVPSPGSPTTSLNGQSSLYSQEELAKGSKGKFSNMFFFGKQRSPTRSTSGPQVHASGSMFFRKNDHQDLDDVPPSDNLVPPLPHNEEGDHMGLRRRSDSTNSIGSLQMSLGESFSASGMLNLWGDNTPRMSNVGLEPSRSHISTTLSIDRNPNSSGFGGPGILGTSQRGGFESQASSIGWSAFSNANRSSTYVGSGATSDDQHLEATWDHRPNDTISHYTKPELPLDPPIIVVDNPSSDTNHGSIESGTDAGIDFTSHHPPSKGRFSKKGFVGLFTSSSSDHGSRGTPESIGLGSDEQHEHSSISDSAGSIETGLKDSGLAPPAKETILQKGMRTFSGRKAGSTGSSSAGKGSSSSEDKSGSISVVGAGKESVAASTAPKSKFTMRRLSMFGKKDSTKDGEDMEHDKLVLKEDLNEEPTENEESGNRNE